MLIHIHDMHKLFKENILKTSKTECLSLKRYTLLYTKSNITTIKVTNYIQSNTSSVILSANFKCTKSCLLRLAFL